MANLLKYALLLSVSLPLTAKDYGVHGRTFPIEEEDLLDYIHNKIKNAVPHKLESKHCIPASVEGLIEAVTYSVHYFDPTIAANEDIKDAQGKIIIPKGSSYNPLDNFSLTQDLLFFNGDSHEHIQWANGCGEQTKWILVKGNPFELEATSARAVFFDQRGTLVKKLSIKTIPTRVSQEGKRLKIESFPLKEVKCSS